MTACVSYKPNPYNTRYLAPPPADPPTKMEREGPVRYREPAQRRRAVASRNRKAAGPCKHKAWHRVRGKAVQVRCKRCKLVRDVTPEEQAALCPQPREGGQRRPITHGTRSGYARGCRLDCCREAEVRGKRESRHAKNPPREKTTKEPVSRETCQHPTWWFCRHRKHDRSQIQCRTCGVTRTCDKSDVKRLCHSGTVSPDQIPAARVNLGRPRKESECGTHRTYTGGCRCDKCVDFHREYWRGRYADSVGREVRGYRKVA